MEHHMLCKDHINSAKMKSLHKNRYWGQSWLFTESSRLHTTQLHINSHANSTSFMFVPAQLEKLFISNSSKGKPPNVHMMQYLSVRLRALTMWAMMLSLWREGCRLNRTISPSIRCRSTISPNFSSWAIFSRFPYFKNLMVTHDNGVRDIKTTENKSCVYNASSSIKHWSICTTTTKRQNWCWPHH